MRNVHNIKEANMVEDMGRRMQKVYVALDNGQENYQSHKIEVQSKIYNHPIAILIDFGASHGYIDCNLIEIFKLRRCKHENS